MRTRRTMLASLAALSAVPTMLGAIVRGGGATRPARGEEKHVPELSVELLGPVTSLKGHAWPSVRGLADGKPDQPRLMTAVDQPHNLAVRLPSGRKLAHWSKLTFLNQLHGNVLEVTLIPHAELLLYQDAVAELERLLREWDAEPGPETKARLVEWKGSGGLKAGPSSLSQSGGGTLQGDTKAYLFFQIRPGDGGWFVSMTVSATPAASDELRRLHSARPATGPATMPATTRPAPK